MSETPAPVPTWRKVVAAILDFVTVFFIGGFAIGAVTNERTADGFELSGASAVVLFVLIALYFVIGTKYLGGTIWQRILRTRG